MPFGGLRRRGEQRLREFVGFPQPCGERLRAHGALLLVFFPRRPGQVTAHDTFHGQWLGFLHDHAATGQDIHVGPARFGEFLGVHGPQVMRHQAAVLPQAIEPELRQLREHVAFAGDSLRQDHVKGRNTVACDQQQTVTQVVHVPHLALALRAKTEVRFKNCRRCPHVTHDWRSFSLRL